tara:strand:+ start:20873 stop:21076 length:204 start_codon:yes stop_codon:yes gene_type:complete
LVFFYKKRIIPPWTQNFFIVFRGKLMKNFQIYLSTAPVLAAVWFSALAGMLIELNRFFPDALSFPLI